MKRSLCVLAAMLCAASAVAADGIETRPPLRSSPAKFDSAHEYDVQHYTVWVNLPFTNDSLYGHVRMSAISEQAGLTSVALNAANLTIDSVRYNGRDTSFQYGANLLSIDLPGFSNGEYFTVDVFYRLGNRGGSRLGYYWYPKGYNAGTLHAVGYSMAEPQDARYWVPCFDQPWDKADSGCAISVTLPDSFMAAANGLFQDTVRSGNKLTWHWEEYSPIATYLMCFTASRFSFWADTAHTINAGAVPLNYFIWPEDSAASRTVFATVPAMTRLYDSLFHPYPFSKYGMAAVYPFAFGGMEHQGMTTIHRNWITGNSQRGIAHELAHMWYGDLVTCGTWADIWLNEGFGSYLEAVYDEWLNLRLPGTYMKYWFNSALTGINANTHPIYDPPPEHLFDGSMVYAKGAWVVQGLRWVMGDSLFFPMMRAYDDSFAYGNAVTTDYQRIAEHHYGQPLDWFFGQWVHRAGHPKYTTAIYYRTSPDSNRARVKIVQTSTTGELYTMPLQLACSTRVGITDTVVWVSTAAAGDFVLIDTLPVLKVTLDRDNWVLKEWGDSLPHLTRLSTYTKAGGAVIAEWNRFTVDPGIAGYNLYRGMTSSGPFARVNAAIINDSSFTDTGVDSGATWFYCVTAVNGADTTFETHFSNVLSMMAGGVNGGPGAAATGILTLGQNKPNPFTASTAISYELSAIGAARLSVYNAAGQLVRTLVDGVQSPGVHSTAWNGKDRAGRTVSSGVYFYQLRAGGRTLIKAMRVIK